MRVRLACVKEAPPRHAPIAQLARASDCEGQGGRKRVAPRVTDCNGSCARTGPYRTPLVTPASAGNGLWQRVAAQRPAQRASTPNAHKRVPPQSSEAGRFTPILTKGEAGEGGEIHCGFPHPPACSCRPSMKPLLPCLVASLLFSAAAANAKPCGNPAGVVATWQAAEAQCACEAATRHRSYLSCASRVAHEAVASGALPRGCKAAVISCAHRSVCGKPDHVTCCRTTPKGTTTCAIRRSARACLAHPPEGGHSYLSSFSSVCDACPAGVCTLGVSAMPEDCRSILVSWSNPEVSVTIARSTDNATWTTVLSASRVGQATFLDTDLQPSTAYYYRVTPLPGR